MIDWLYKTFSDIKFSQSVIKNMDLTIRIAVIGENKELRQTLIKILFSNIVLFEDKWIFPDVLPEKFFIKEFSWEKIPQVKEKFDYILGISDFFNGSNFIDEMNHLMSLNHMSLLLIMPDNIIKENLLLLPRINILYLKLIKQFNKIKLIKYNELNMIDTTKIINKIIDSLKRQQKDLTFVRYLNNKTIIDHYVFKQINKYALYGTVLFLFELYSFPTIKNLVSFKNDINIIKKYNPPTMIELIDALVHTISYLYTRKKAPKSLINNVHSVLKWAFMPLYLLSGISGGVMAGMVYMVLFSLGHAIHLLLSSYNNKQSTTN